ncbi:hypothetical protein DEO72_LG5g1974 [Vigna unguiculata]|uniref:Uncharacterized protein n=1 Tax=Vigna unguiculata TaxID=3917 RepID=A0A4D6LZY0_VIGUN|nr:hypothetical protein DEO72_LG5g1974 [Vigna unguiculata]
MEGKCGDCCRASPVTISFSLALRRWLLSMCPSFPDLALHRVAWCRNGGCCLQRWLLLTMVVVAYNSGCFS